MSWRVVQDIDDADVVGIGTPSVFVAYRVDHRLSGGGIAIPQVIDRWIGLLGVMPPPPQPVRWQPSGQPSSKEGRCWVR